MNEASRCVLKPAARLEEIMKCPVDWEPRFGRDDWLLCLPHLDWYYSFSQIAIEGNECDLPFYPEEFEVVYDHPPTLESLLRNLASRRCEAVHLYMSRAGHCVQDKL
jgi:hypothetical protein